MNEKLPPADNTIPDAVDEASWESFPASDPPSYSPGTYYERVRPAGASPPPSSGVSSGQRQAFAGEEPASEQSCCGGSSFQHWSVLLAVTAAGLAVSGFLAHVYAGRR